MLAAAIVLFCIFVISMIVAIRCYALDDFGGGMGGSSFSALTLGAGIAFLCAYCMSFGNPTRVESLDDNRIYQVKGVCNIDEFTAILVCDGGDKDLVCVRVEPPIAVEVGAYIKKSRTISSEYKISLEPISVQKKSDAQKKEE